MGWDGTERNYAADILKGIGIVFVVITHFSWSSTERRIYLFPFWIDMAVPVFMIISGFAHSASFEKRHIEKIRLAYAGEGGFGVCSSGTRCRLRLHIWQKLFFCCQNGHCRGRS